MSIKKIITISVMALMATLGISPQGASAATTVTGGPLTGLAATGATIHLALSNFPTTAGLYIQQCNAPASPGARPSDCSATPLWISTQPGATFAPTADIKFNPTAIFASKTNTIDCTKVSCGIWISYDHTKLSDKSEDQFIPITFKEAGSAVVLPADEISATLNGAALNPRAAIELAYRGPGKLVATTKSGSEITWASSTGDCTIDKNTVTALKGDGFCNLQAISKGNTSYAAFTANYPVKLIPGDQAVSPKKFPNTLKRGKTKALVLNSPFGEVITYSTSTKSICTVEGNLVEGKKKGNCNLILTAPAKDKVWNTLNQKVTIKIS